MDFYVLDYIFAETQFTHALSLNLKEKFYFTWERGDFDSSTLTMTHVSKVEVAEATLDHVAAQNVIDEGILHFTKVLSDNRIEGMKFKRIEVLKAIRPSVDGKNRSYALVVSYTVPLGKRLKTLG